MQQSASSRQLVCVSEFVWSVFIPACACLCGTVRGNRWSQWAQQVEQQVGKWTTAGHWNSTQQGVSSSVCLWMPDQTVYTPNTVVNRTNVWIGRAHDSVFVPLIEAPYSCFFHPFPWNCGLDKRRKLIWGVDLRKQSGYLNIQRVYMERNNKSAVFSKTSHGLAGSECFYWFYWLGVLTLLAF